MQLSFTEKKNIRKNFGKLKEGLSIPNLIEVQKNSYKQLTEFKEDIDQNLVNRVIKYASIKHIISKKNEDEQKIIEIFSEIIRDLKNCELEFRIAELESKFSKDLSEDTFNELKELKKQQKIN